MASTGRVAAPSEAIVCVKLITPAWAARRPGLCMPAAPGPGTQAMRKLGASARPMPVLNR